MILIRNQVAVPVADLPPILGQQPAPAVYVPTVDGEQPTPEDCRRLLVATSADGKEQPTAFYKLAKQRLKGRECFPACFEGAGLASVGDRNRTIVSYTGQVVAMLYGQPGATCEACYALLYDAASQLEPDRDNPDWPAWTWQETQRAWNKEASAQANVEQDACTLTLRVLKGMSSWCKHPALYGPEHDALAFVQEHMIACVRDVHYVMTQDGRYDAIPVSEGKVAARVRELCMGQLIPIEEFNQDGGRKAINPREIITRHSTTCKEVKGQVNDEGGRIEGIGTEDAALIVKSYRLRTDLEPRPSAEVAEWMALSYEENTAKVERWIGLALCVERLRPICALSIKGWPGCGKQMVMEGLSQCITTEYFIDGAELFDDFREGLLATPFVNINESWPGGYKQMHPADMFRRLTGGDTMRIKQKFLATVSFRNPLRLVLTANNMNLVNELCAKRDLSEEDREALAIRLFHVDVGRKASDWLRQHGGWALTGDWCKKGGSYTLARHFLWLQQQVAKDVGDPRLLMEGGFQPNIADNMRMNSGAAPIVIETIVQMLNAVSANRTFRGLTIEGSSVYVLASEVVDYFRKNLAQTVKFNLHSQNCGSVLRGLDACDPTSRRLESRKELSKQWWHKLDTRLLLASARKDGRPCKLLQDLVEGAEITTIAEVREAKSA